MDYAVLILSAAIGGGIGYFFHNNNLFCKRLLMFSAGLLLTITVLEMFPMLYQNHGGIGINAGIWIIAGVGLQLVLESLSKGIEHGHVHHHHENENVVPLSVMFGLFVHSFLDGMPIEAQAHTHEHLHLLWALAVHKIPETIVLSAFLFTLRIPKSYAFGVLLLFVFSAPLGAWLGTFLSLDFYLKMTGIVAGIFLHISSIIIFESNEKHNLNKQKLFFVFLGIFAGWLLTLS